MMNNEQHKQIRNVLMVAAVDCGHTIDSDRIILQCDPAKQGNALAQLCDRLLDAYLAAAGARAAPVEPFQARVQPWMMECFGAEISADGAERNHRFLEESLELVQACGCTASEAHQLVDYVYSRPVGERAQEVGGVMVTLAALCLAQGLNMHAAGETELARIWTKVEAIRAKQAAKPKHSPLPGAAPAAQGDAKDAERLVIEEKAQEIYSTWQSQPEFVAWQHGGNSHMQERARDMARVVIAAKAAS